MCIPTLGGACIRRGVWGGGAHRGDVGGRQGGCRGDAGGMLHNPFYVHFGPVGVAFVGNDGDALFAQ